MMQSHKIEEELHLLCSLTQDSFLETAAKSYSQVEYKYLYSGLLDFIHNAI